MVSSEEVDRRRRRRGRRVAKVLKFVQLNLQDRKQIKVEKGKKAKNKHEQQSTKYIKLAASGLERFTSHKWSDGKVNM